MNLLSLALPNYAYSQMMQLVTEVTGQSPSPEVLIQALDAADNCPGALLARLREIQARGWNCAGVWGLAQTVRRLYWLR